MRCFNTRSFGLIGGQQPSTSCSTTLPAQYLRLPVLFQLPAPQYVNYLPDFIRDPTISADCFRRLLNGPVVHPKNFKRLCMGDKVPPCSVSNILDNWLRIVARVSLSYAAIQAESNELFGVIIKRIFVKIFRKFQRHCFRRFSRDVGCRGCGRECDICWS